MRVIKGRRSIVLFGYKLNQFGLRKCPRDHWLINKACKQYHSNKNFSALYLQDGGEIWRPLIWNKITSLSPYVYSHCSSVSEWPCTELGLSVEPCHPSQRYRITAAPSVCSTEHTCGPTLQTDHIRPSSIFCCGSHSVEQSSCRIQRPDNQRCLLPTAFKDSSLRTTASAP